jgi:hypothetical protein
MLVDTQALFYLDVKNFQFSNFNFSSFVALDFHSQGISSFGSDKV